MTQVRIISLLQTLTVAIDKCGQKHIQAAKWRDDAKGVKNVSIYMLSSRLDNDENSYKLNLVVDEFHNQILVTCMASQKREST